MTARRQRPSRRRNLAEALPAEPPSRRALWWLLAFILLLGTTPGQPGDAVRIVPAPVEGALAPEWAWSVPVARLPALQILTEGPFWLFAAVAAGVIAYCAASLTTGWSWAVGALVLGLGLKMQSLDLLPAVMILAAGAAARSQRLQKHPRQAVAVFVGLGCVSVLVSLEFGLACCVCGAMLMATVLAGLHWKLRTTVTSAAVLTSVAVVAVVEQFSPGFVAALLRPISWSWIQPSSNLLPKTATVLHVGQGWLPDMLLSLFLLDCWRRRFAKAGGVGIPVAALGICSLIGWGCAQYLAVCVFVVASISRPVPRSTWHPWVGRLAYGACFAFAVVQSLPRSADYYDYFTTGNSSPRSVDPTRWQTSGRVVLLNLSQSHDWQTNTSRQQYQVMLDDRWDVYGGQYSDYAAVCDDMVEVRSDSYLRSNGAWGGYQRWLSEWSPRLLAADSGNLEDIRRLSGSPHWKLMGIDGKRTIFGRADDPQNQALVQKMGRVLFELEWPTGARDIWDPTVIVANDADAARRVAAVLCAIRLPYAGLRTIFPDDDSLTAHKLRIWCYLELAHRAHRHSGRASLLDQFRTISRLRQARLESQWTPAELLRIASSLEGLELYELAEQFAGDVGKTGWLRTASATQQAHAQVIQQRCRTKAVETSSVTLESTGQDDVAVQSMQSALTTGNEIVALQEVGKLPPAIQPFYAALANAQAKSPVELFSELRDSLPTGDGLEELQSEAFFYLACLAIELGDPSSATHALYESARLDPNSPFSSLRQMYYGQISKRAQ